MLGRLITRILTDREARKKPLDIRTEDYLGPMTAEGKTVNFVKTRPLSHFLPTDLDTPESQEALRDLQR